MAALLSTANVAAAPIPIKQQLESLAAAIDRETQKPGRKSLAALNERCRDLRRRIASLEDGPEKLEAETALGQIQSLLESAATQGSPGTALARLRIQAEDPGMSDNAGVVFDGLRGNGEATLAVVAAPADPVMADKPEAAKNAKPKAAGKKNKTGKSAKPAAKPKSEPENDAPAPPRNKKNSSAKSQSSGRGATPGKGRNAAAPRVDKQAGPPKMERRPPAGRKKSAADFSPDKFNVKAPKPPDSAAPSRPPKKSAPNNRNIPEPPRAPARVQELRTGKPAQKLLNPALPRRISPPPPRSPMSPPPVKNSSPFRKLSAPTIVRQSPAIKPLKRKIVSRMRKRRELRRKAASPHLIALGGMPWR